MKHGSITILLAALTVAATAGAARADDADFASRVAGAIEGGSAFLLSRIDSAGKVAGEYPADNPNGLFGGRTCLAVYALLSAGASEQDPSVARAIDWITGVEMDGTYPVALRACALSRVWRKDVSQPLADDVAWLLKAADAEGGYSYTSLNGAARGRYDNSSSQVAVMGVRAGMARGVAVPREYWTRVRSHWLDQQQVDGGWGYMIPPGAVRTRAYGSMTAAGLATLYACFDNLESGQFVRCNTQGGYAPIDSGLKWLGGNFLADENPGKGLEWYYAWLFNVQRVGQASGYRFFGGRDWYAAGAEALLEQRREDGSWGIGEPGDRVVPTALAILFLAGGRNPVVFDKLQYEGKWNSRPRDMANLVARMGVVFERPLAWEVVGAQAHLEPWRGAPILYISGAGPCELSEVQMSKLRRFVLRGGTIVSEAACNSGAFTLDMQRLQADLFPQWAITRLADNHPVYSLRYKVDGLGGLTAVSNGVRLLMIHSPKEVSLGLQLGAEAKENLPAFELMSNIFLLATDGGNIGPRGADPWPEQKPFEPAATIRVARIRHDGNWDPEPLAWERMAIEMGNRHRVRLVVSEPIAPEKLAPNAWPVAVMTGTEEVVLPKEAVAAIARYVEGGGTLIVDAAGGSATFAAAVRKQILPQAGTGIEEAIPAEHPFYRGVEIAYRRGFAEALGPGRNTGRLRGVRAGDRFGVVFSPEDMTAGLVGCLGYDIRGYDPASARSLMASILLTAAGLRADATGEDPAPPE